LNTLASRLLPLLILALPTIASAAPPKPASAPAPVMQDWSKVATRLPSGFFLQGNPNAKVKLVEYLSFTCPHCAAFEAEGAAPLAQRYIRTGQVSYEVRIALRDSFDLVAAMLARCNGPQAFFAVKPAVFAAQKEWLTKGEQWGATGPKLEKMSEIDAGKAIAAGAGLDAFFLKHGLPRARIDACLANATEQHALAEAAQKIWQPGFPGTPAFEINGTIAGDIHDWAALDAKLKAALG
jgi:protein-disulfide isomerase